MKYLNIYVVVFFLLLLSCTNKTNKRLRGSWSVDLDSSIVSHRNWDIVGNSIDLNKKDCILPRIFKNKLNQDSGRWYFNSTEDSIFFDVPENPLNGKYKVQFYKDYDKLQFKMRLTNDSTLLICSKSIIGNSSNTLEFLKDY